MEDIRFADAHCDFLYNMTYLGQNIYDMPSEKAHITLDSLTRGKVCLQTFAVWVDTKSPILPLEMALEMVDSFYRMLGQSGSRILFLNHENASEIISSGRTGAVLSLEGADCLCGSASILNIFYRLGVRMISLTWNQKNMLACGAHTRHDTGLSELGREMVYKINESKIALDLAHLGRKSFWDCYNISKSPVLSSHTCANRIQEHPRNLDDEQIKAIIECGGFIGITFYPNFFGGGRITAKDICRHIDHVVSLGGINTVGIGSDFDGIKSMPDGIQGPADMYKIAVELENLGYSKEAIEKIAYGNLLDYIIKFL
jgi:membrane dipeptidase